MLQDIRPISRQLRSAAAAAAAAATAAAAAAAAACSLMSFMKLVYYMPCSFTCPLLVNKENGLSTRQSPEHHQLLSRRLSLCVWKSWHCDITWEMMSSSAPTTDVISMPNSPRRSRPMLLLLIFLISMANSLWGVMLTKWHHNEFSSKAYVNCILWAIVQHFDGTSQEVFHSHHFEYKRLLLVVKVMEK
jgi:hypothetical protein